MNECTALQPQAECRKESKRKLAKNQKGATSKNWPWPALAAAQFLYSDSSDFDGFSAFLRIPSQFFIATPFRGVQFYLPTPFGLLAPNLWFWDHFRAILGSSASEARQFFYSDSFSGVQFFYRLLAAIHVVKGKRAQT